MSKLTILDKPYILRNNSDLDWFKNTFDVDFDFRRITDGFYTYPVVIFYDEYIEGELYTSEGTLKCQSLSLLDEKPNLDSYELQTSVKQDNGKRRLDLLPWDALDLVGDVLTYGIIKYPNPEENWRQNSKPEDIKRYKAALLRHFSAQEQGQVFDEESGLPHMAHIATNALFILALEKKYGVYSA